jgi:hypothetical protein
MNGQTKQFPSQILFLSPQYALLGRADTSLFFERATYCVFGGDSVPRRAPLGPGVGLECGEDKDADRMR